MTDIATLRGELQQKGLYEADAPPEPHELLAAWRVQAERAGLHRAMVVATADSFGKPSCRAVNLRRSDASGLVFYTNYESRKGRELAENPNAACLLVWYELSRQIRVEGGVSRLPQNESDAYFATRERGACLEAWASRQSEPITDRAWLENRFKKYDERFTGVAVPRPPHWGGYLVSPDTYEFWQGRPNRMHDRLLYERVGVSEWKISRLSP